MANNCSNSNTNSCSPCTGCEDIVSSDCVSVLSSISCINMSSGDNLTDVLNALGSAVCNFYSLIDAGNGLTVSEVDGSPSYAATNLLRFNQDSGFIVTQPSANTADVRLIPTFLFPDSNLVIVDAVTTANITLSGAQTIDTIVGVAGTTKVLVWKQTLKTENGIYIMQAGAWTRSTDSDTSAELNDQVAFANYTKTGTQYGNKYFNQIAVSPVIGADNIIYQVGTGNVNNKWTKGGDIVEQIEIFGTLDTYPIPFYTDGVERMRLLSTGELVFGITSSPLGRVHIKGKGSSQSPLYVASANGLKTFEIRDNGQIYRDGILYSWIGNNSNTSWGNEALLNNATVQNTAFGYRAGKAITTAGGSTLFGYLCGTSLTTQNWNCFYGDEVGLLMTDAVQNTLIGTKIATSVSSGGFGGNVIVGYTGGDSLTGGCHDNIMIGHYVSRRLYSALPRATIHGNIMIGDYCGDDVDGSYNILIGAEGGWNLESGLRNIFIGHAVDNYSFSSGDITNSVSTPDISDSLSFGNRTTVTANNQIVFGSEVYPYTEMYIGEGVTSSTPQIFSINATGGSGTDIAGGHLIIASGKSTGSATPPSIIFRTSVPSSTGSTPQSLTSKMIVSGIGTTFSYRSEFGKGTDTAAANDLTLPLDGNLFSITGNTQINRIAVLDWQAGSEIILIFTGTPTVKHNQATGGGFNIILLNGSVDLVAAPNTVLKLIYDGVSWQETSRKVA